MSIYNIIGAKKQQKKEVIPDFLFYILIKNRIRDETKSSNIYAELQIAVQALGQLVSVN